MALYYFVFEMGYVALKLESATKIEYKSKKKWIKIAKAAVMFELLII